MSNVSDTNQTNKGSYNIPGSFPNPSPNLELVGQMQPMQTGLLEFSPQRRAYLQSRPNQKNQPFSSPQSIHSRSESVPCANGTPSPSTRRLPSKSKSHTNFLKLIPPMPDSLYPPLHDYQRQQQFPSNQQNQRRQPLQFNATPSTQYSNHNPPQQLLPPQQIQSGTLTPSTGLTKNTPISRQNNNFTPPTTLTPTLPSVCSKCGLPITTKSVKALGKRYHTQCFGCADCGTPILSKYFPYETETGEKLPLCEEHFYIRRGLVCCVCNSFLKGTHYTVFGRKYDAEHFCCKICSKKFKTDEDFFNHDGNVYCHYHFSKFFIERCEGCEFAILKQYVEIFRGGKNQKWHVECYMIHKCWNVAISSNSIGIPSFPRIEPTEANIKNSKDINPTPDELLVMEAKASEKISEIWNTLFKFEEDTATCISNMLQFTTIKDQQKGLEATAKLVFKIDALFKSLDSLHRLGIDPTFTGITAFETNSDDNRNAPFTLKKEPRNLSAKVMVYLGILRKISKGLTDSSSSQDLILSVVTGLAHYLKSLIRYGLNSSLQYNKNSHTTNALEKFLREIRNHEAFLEDDVFRSLDVPTNASDLCFHCQKSIENECVQFKEKRWHVTCITCSRCHKSLQEIGGLSDASFNSEKSWVLCAHCALDDPDAKPGFRMVSKLLQLSYLLKIAVTRSRAVMEYEYRNGINQPIKSNPDSQSDTLYEQSYLKTLSDIKRLKSTRQNTKVTIPTDTKENARKSVIIETTDNTETSKISAPYKTSNNPEVRLSADELISRQRITVEDEPLGPTQMSKNSFNRATTFINNQKILTLDDIPRIVAAEHARELRPNTYKFHNPHQTEEKISKGIQSKNNSIHRNAPSIKEKSSSYTKKSVALKYYSELSTFEAFVIKHISAVILKHLLHRYSVGHNIDTTKLFELKKNPSFWDKLKGIGNNDKKGIVLNKVFGSELSDLTKKTGVDSSQSNGPSKVRIPLLIDDLLTALYQKDMSVEGVFRKNGNLKTLRELIEAINANPSRIPPLDKENVVQLSALLKKFLREMPNPLLTFNLYDLWILSQKTKDNIPTRVFTELSYSLLPKAHRDLSEVLLFFFMWASSFSHIDEQSGSKMDIHNLATVLSPNILYDKPNEVSRPSNNKGVAAKTYFDTFGENEGENYYLAIEVVDYLITHSEELSVVPRYLVDLYEMGKFNESESITSKELFNRIEQILASNPGIINEIIEGAGNDASGITEEGEEEEDSVLEESDIGQEAIKTSYD